MTELLNTRPIIRVDGEPSAALRNDVQWLAIDHDVDGLKTLRATFVSQSDGELAGDQPSELLDGAIVDFGRVIEIELGAGARARTLFNGVVSAVEVELAEGKPALLQVYAEDKLMALRMTRGSFTYRDLDDQGIAEEVARRHELRVAADAPGPTYEIVQQWNQSDLAFLRERARRIQAEIWFDDDRLHFKTRDKRESPDLDPLVFGNDLIEVSIRADLAHQRTDAHITGYDAAKRETIDKSDGESALNAETEGGRTGYTVLDQALGANKSSYRVRDVALTTTEAEAWSKAEALRRGRRFVVASGVTNGTPDLGVGSRLELRRVGRPFTGAGYYATKVQHSWHHERGHRTSFEAERPVISEAS